MPVPTVERVVKNASNTFGRSLAAIPMPFRGWVALVAVVFGAALLVESFNHLRRHLSTRRKEKKVVKQNKDYLSTLSPEEKGIMAIYFTGASDTQYLLTTDGKVGSLLAKGSFILLQL
jgi:Super-infection exclusion protein B